MDEKIAHQILDELLSSFEALETQSAAILQFVKAKGIATDEDLAPYFQQAAEASSVRWRAARVRINRLLSSAIKSAEPRAEKEPAQAAPKSQQPPANTSREATHTKQTDKKESDGHDTGSKETAEAGSKETAEPGSKETAEPGSKDTSANQSGTKDTGSKELSGDPQVAQKGDANSKPEAAAVMTGDQNKEKEENSKPGSDAGKRAA
jgi:hypothetical protein